MPCIGTDVISGNAVAIVGRHTEIELCIGIPLFRGLCEPLHRFPDVLWDALALGIHQAEIELGKRNALIRSLSIIVESLRGILWNVMTEVVHEAKMVVRKA